MININTQLTPSRSGPAVGTWRTPLLIIGFGCLISLMSFGPRSALGFFLTPMSAANHWGRDVFAFALALQNLLWGIGQPLAGIIADRFGTGRVLCVGGLMYAAGLALMSQAAGAPVVDFSAIELFNGRATAALVAFSDQPELFDDGKRVFEFLSQQGIAPCRFGNREDAGEV
jgi:MFS family permease